MDLDLAHVRAFVAVVDEAHFGRAAAALRISQQGLSKRIARLEELLGVRLLDRTARTLALTDAGCRFVEPARRLLAEADLAVAAARRDERPLRLDVWGHLYGPLRTVSQALDGVPHVAVELGRARDLPSAVSALGRGEIDLGFGRVHPLGDAASTGLRHRLARLEPLDAVLSDRHPLAGRAELRPGELRGSTLLFPATPARLDFLTRFADHVGIPGRRGAVNLGLRHLLDVIAGDRTCFTLLPADLALAAGGVRCVPLVEPTPLYAWSLLWLDGHEHRRLADLLDAFAAAARPCRWLEYRPGDWLPEPDRADAVALR